MTPVSRPAWPEIRPPSVCPICGQPRRCKLSPDGRVVLCFRSREGAFKLAGEVGGLYRRGDSAPLRVASTSDEESRPRANEAHLDRVYVALLDCLPLWWRDRKALRERGLSNTAIDRAGYRTLPPWREDRLAAGDRLADRLGLRPSRNELLGVPGFHLCLTVTGVPEWTFGPRGGGILLPSRNVAGEITSVKVRLTYPPKDGSRYRLLSGSDCRNNAQVHVPLGTPRRCETVVVTEGELKADVARHLSGWPVISIPGVSIWKPVIPVLRSLTARQVLVAFDADFATKGEVKAALVTFLRGLREAGLAAGLLTWDPRLGKGLDDVLTAGHADRIRLRSRPSGKEQP